MVQDEIDWQIFLSGRKASFERRHGTNLSGAYLR